MSDQNPCPKCQSPFAYQDGALWTCPECGNEFNPKESADLPDVTTDSVIRDSNGVELMDGDTVTVIKDLKIKGSSNSVKVGTKVKNIRLNPDSGDGHNISCKIPDFGAMGLKSEYVKKV
jgi:protein PhnA